MGSGGSRRRGRGRAVAASRRIYRVLMRAYPRDIRERYGEEMVGCFSDACRDEVRRSGSKGLAAVWLHALPDLIFTALKERSNMSARNAYLSAVGVALAAAFLLFWLNGAVGIIGTEDNAANLMFGGVLAVGIVGAVMARFRPHGMARAMFATALAQALVAVIVLIFGLTSPLSGPVEILALIGFFVSLFVGSALLFRYAAREQTPAGAGLEG